jgi:Na+/proline symporter
LTGLIVAALVIQRQVELPDPEFAFGYATRELLKPGLTGLMISCVLAANMSTCSNFMVNTGALFTRNFYKEYFNTDATDKQLLWTGRFSGFGLTLLGVLFALTIKNVLHGFLFTETIAAFMGVMVLGGILWKRANRQGATMGVIAAFGVYYVLNYLDTGTLLLVYKWKPEPFGWAMLAGFSCLILVSLMTKPEKEEKIEAFFDNMRRLSDAVGLAKGEVKPLASEHGKDLVFLDLPGWLRKSRWQGFPGRYKEDLVGFVLAWIVVALLIFLAWGLMQF